jgi:hypothetical protein
MYRQNSAINGAIKGEPRKYLNGHHVRKGKESASWKGGRIIQQGYIMVAMPGHPRGDKQGYVPEQYLIVENIIGKILPLHVIIHHNNRKRHDNSNNNLVVCQNASYHSLIHEREKAYMACGNAKWRSCQFCHCYDDPNNMVDAKTHYYHRLCKNSYQNNRNKLIRKGIWQTFQQ